MSIRRELPPRARADERLLFMRALARSRNINPRSGLSSGLGGCAATLSWARSPLRPALPSDRGQSAVPRPETYKNDQETR
jgi:hypothetical protein